MRISDWSSDVCSSDLNLISDAALEQRTREALAAGNANLAAALVKRLPAPRAAPLQQWLRLLQDPKSALAGIAADPRQNFEWAALNAGFQKLSRRDPPTAQAVLAQLDRKRLSEAQYGELRRAVALGRSEGHTSEPRYLMRT